jgi:hypothetical protein
MGTLHDAALEALVIDSVNRVLDRTDYSPEDREDTGGEDFWIVGPQGEVAIAEVKGISGDVRRRDVNQVDNHRSELGRSDDELPGLLVINTYRGDDDLERKRQAPHPSVLRLLRSQNVLLLRGADLYELVSRAINGEHVGDRLVEALSAGGGWLEATPERIEVRQPQ